MSLVAEYNSGSDTESERKNEEKEENLKHEANGHENNRNQLKQNDVTENEKEESSPSKKITLPAASSVMKRKMPSETSVFPTKYDKQAETQTKALEQHVKMVKNSKTINGKVNGKKVCWMYRRGRCRLGKKCKMYHDSELQITEAKRTSEPEQKNEEPPPTAVTRHKREFEEITNNDEDCDAVAKKIKKKHFGLSDDLVPSQKVIRHLEKVSTEGNHNL